MLPVHEINFIPLLKMRYHHHVIPMFSKEIPYKAVSVPQKDYAVQ